MTRSFRVLALASLLVASRASAATALFSTLQPDGTETLTTLPLATDGSAAGPAFDVVHDPALWLGTAHPRFSPDGTQILFRASDDTKTPYDRLLVVPAAGGAPVDITPGAPVASLLSGASWTPDGARALVVGVIEDPNGPWHHELFSVPVAGGAALQLTFDGDGGSKYFPLVSPDGRWIAYGWERPSPSGASTYVLAVIPVTGGRPRVIDTNVAKANAASWSGDSRFLAYARWNAQKTYTDVYRAELSTGTRKNLTGGRFQGQPTTTWQGSVSSPVFSPDGARIAFAYVAGPRPSDRGDVYVIGASGGAATRVNGIAPIAMNSIEMGFAWSPDGVRVLFPYVDSDALVVSPAWPWNEGLASTGVGAPLYGPLFPGQVAGVTVR